VTLHSVRAEPNEHRSPWDENVQRVETGLGHHLTRDLLVKAVAQVYERGDGWEWKSLLPAAQLSFRY